MKRLSLIILVVLLALGSVACDDASASADAEANTSTAEASTTEIFSIDGMTCVNCAADIQDILGDMEGVSQGDVDFGAREATIGYDEEVIDRQSIIDAVADGGYELTLVENNE